MIIAFFFVIGLVIGSFLNAVIYRLRAGKSIAMDRSMCPNCKHVLGIFDLIPVVSFIFLRGRCRYCHHKISFQYPIVELLTGLTFALSSYNLSPITYHLWIQLIFATFLILIAVYDLKYYLILDKVLVPAVALALVYVSYESYYMGSFGFNSPLVQGLVGILIISGFFASQYYLSAGRWIGFGDVKLGIFLGLLFGLGQSLVLLFLAYCLGAVVGVVLIALKRKEMGSKLPFGTFLAFCAIIMLLYGPGILAWYLRIIGF